MTTINQPVEDNEPLLPFYVYVLAHPTDKKVFYVGKGQEERLYQHWNEVNRTLRNELPPDGPKQAFLRRLADEGLTPLQKIIGRYNLESEAFAVEATLINWMYGYDNLSNQKRGKGAHLIRPQGNFDELLNIDVPRPDRIDNGMLLVHLENFFQAKTPQRVFITDFSRFVFNTVENILSNSHPEKMTEANLIPVPRPSKSRITHFLDDSKNPFPREKVKLPKVIFRNRLDGNTSKSHLHIEITKSKKSSFESIFSTLNLTDATRAEVTRWIIKEHDKQYELLLPAAAKPNLIKSVLLTGVNHAVENILNSAN
ncbi:MAG: GIY-YIG nuclease family protein [Bdellovibrio sp.]